MSFGARLKPPTAIAPNTQEGASEASPEVRDSAPEAGESAPEAGESALNASDTAPFYLPGGNEVSIFAECHAHGLAVMLKGPTGCGKTRLVEHMAWQLGRPLVTVSCHDDLTASDLVGRYLIRHDGTVWQDGPLTRAVRDGAICYLDEIVEARQDTVVVLHSLTDYRRSLSIDKTGEQLQAAPGFQLVISYNPAYQRLLKDLKASTRQRFVALELGFPEPEQEAAIVTRESGVEAPVAHELVTLAERMRALRDRGLAEVPSTRLLIAAAALVNRGVPVREASRVAVVAPLTDDESLGAALCDLVDATFV